MCRKERGCFPGRSAFRGQMGREEEVRPRQTCRGAGGCGVLALVPHPPVLGSWKRESSLIGSLAVSFTLNVKVKQRSQASPHWQRRGEPFPAESGVLGTVVLHERGLPSLTPPPARPSGDPVLPAGGV